MGRRNVELRAEPAPAALGPRQRAVDAGSPGRKRAIEPQLDAVRAEPFDRDLAEGGMVAGEPVQRSEEHTSELQSLMRISYAVFCLKKQKEKKANDSRGKLNRHTKHKSDATDNNKV